MDWNTFDNVPARLAAAAILVRGDHDAETLLVRRNDRLQFMPGHHAFPGGGIDPEDDPAQVSGAGDPVLKRAIFAAAREVFEETGLMLAKGRLPDLDALRQARRALHAGEHTFSAILRQFGLMIHGEDFTPAGLWTTPGFSPVRFRTHYFLYRYHGEGYQEVLEPDGEIVALDWLRPSEARRQWHEDRLSLSTPIGFTLRRLAALPLEEVLPALENPQAMPNALEPRAGVQILPLRTHTLPPAEYTNCVIIGEHELYVIDPGPCEPEEQHALAHHLDNLIALGAGVTAILITHAHSDHTGAAPWLRQRYRAPVCCHPDTAARLHFAVDRVLADGEVLPSAGSPEWRIRCLHTPGHAPGHLCFLEESTGSLVCGDLAANPGTILIDPEDGGDMTAYFESLQRILGEHFSFAVPAHGLPTFRAHSKELFEHLLAHRLEREAKIRAAFEAGADTVETILDIAYDDIPRESWPLAARQMQAHLARLGIQLP
jgi:glyoxylase-like metal-dependent hydrolase (beta-lactamase superfamily II)/8-oxo-dGTP pyrophosphatase MutT (NUDIX family)